MLVELSMVEQRYDAVREVLDGATVTDVAIRYGVDRRTLHRWLVRYANEGLAALADKSSRPDRCPHQVAPEVVSDGGGGFEAEKDSGLLRRLNRYASGCWAPRRRSS